MGSSKMQAGKQAEVRVWDPAVRVFHWTLVSAMAYQFLAEAGTRTHELAGYLILGLAGFRVIWGFAGTHYARFAQFVKSPRETLAYLWAIVTGHPRRYLGHNPAGGAMVIALILAVSATGISGWMMTTDAYWGVTWVEDLHELMSNVTLALIAAHVAGVVLASLQHKENLVRAMFTGRKPKD